MGLLGDALAIPDHLEDALWRVDSARLERHRASGLLVCGMGGSAIGGDLAAAALAGRLEGPLLTIRGYELPGWAGDGWHVLCSSYSGATEETLSCYRAAAALGAPRSVAATGGPLVEAAREDEVPVVGLPGILQPRAAVAYMLVVAARIAGIAGIAPDVSEETGAAASFLRADAGALRERAAEVAAQIGERLPVVYGAGLTAPVARRWKTQLNENAKLQAFHSELPEADHNEICGWDGVAGGAELVVVAIEDAGQPERIETRFALTAEAIAADGTDVVQVRAEGPSPLARMLWAVMLGDLVSLEIAERRGVDPADVTALESLKSALARS